MAKHSGGSAPARGELKANIVKARNIVPTLILSIVLPFRKSALNDDEMAAFENEMIGLKPEGFKSRFAAGGSHVVRGSRATASAGSRN
jgi:hypothetical protein